MIPVILAILKWIGIILLALLGLILLIVCLVLFVPIRYYVRIECKEGWKVYGYGSFLFHLFHISFRVENGEESHVPRLFGIPLRRKKPKKARRRQKREPDKKRTDVLMTGSEEPGEKKPAGPGMSSEEPEEKKPAGSGKAKKRELASEQSVGHGKIKKIIARIRQFLLSIREGLVTIYKRLRNIFQAGQDREKREGGKFAKVQEILTDENTPRLWALVWECIVGLLRHSRPKSVCGRIHFGMDDPCLTGQILGAAGIGYALTGGRVEIIPDFNRRILEGELEIRGWIQIGAVLWLAKKILFSTEWRHFRKQMGA